MLNLPRVTLMAVDTVHPDRTWLALRMSMQWVKFGEVLLLTNLKRFEAKNFPHVRVIHREQSDRKAPVTPPRMVFPDYERDAICAPGEVLQTDYCLYIEHDAGVLNPWAWDDDWLEYDYIGAPWPDHKDPGWPDCDSTNNVGNGGFSLRSARFCRICRQLVDENRNDSQLLISDAWMCRTIRPRLEAGGIVYAPENVAAKFSCENRIYSGQFGFHGRITAALNNWSGSWLGRLRPPR